MRFKTTSMAFVAVEGDLFPPGLEVRLVGSWVAEVRLGDQVARIERDDLDSMDRIELWKLGIEWPGDVEVELWRRAVEVIVEEREGVAAVITESEAEIARTRRLRRRLTETLEVKNVGMYTSVLGELAVRGGVVPFLRWWANYPRGKCPGFPEHFLFTECDAEADDPSATGTLRWCSVLWGGGSHKRDTPWEAPENSYGDPLSYAIDHGDTLVIRVTSTLKNYDGSIEHFVDWITPYVREGWLESHHESAYHRTGYAFVEGTRRAYSMRINDDPDYADLGGEWAHDA